jgi:hypothetical protein
LDAARNGSVHGLHYIGGAVVTTSFIAGANFAPKAEIGLSAQPIGKN